MQKRKSYSVQSGKHPVTKRPSTFNVKRIFGHPRPSGLEPNQKQQAHGNQKFQPLPPPTGQSPYHLSLDSVLPASEISSILKSGGITFHVTGDTGGIMNPNPQLNVASAMEQDLKSNGPTIPAFFYHLGDVVYFFGQADQYYPQFYEPYFNYDVPIFAIPGNHDGDIDPTNPNPPSSLSAFVTNFCSDTPVTSPHSGEAPRHTMTQPNVYWTLDAPFVTIIGLYSNVPEGGEIEQDQIDWFVNELSNAPKNKALIVTVHHPAYSYDEFHGGATNIETLLDNAFAQSTRYPDIVFTGHVHNYQRFTRTVKGREIPYIVAGAGGYHNEHHMRTMPDGSRIQVPFQVPNNPGLTLENYCDNQFGYLIISITSDAITGQYCAVPGQLLSQPVQATKIDSFKIDLKKHQLVSSTMLP